MTTKTITTLAEDTINLLRADHERLKYIVERLQNEVRILRSGRTSVRPWVELTETLLPGESAKALLRVWTNGNWVASSVTEITIYDPASLNFGLYGQAFQVERKHSGRFEVIGSSGIEGVHAKVKTGVTISDNGSGLVEIWEDGSASGVEVTAHLNWLHTESISAGQEIAISYKRAQSKWVVVDNPCE